MKFPVTLAFDLFVFCLVLHVIAWRLRRPKADIALLVMIFFTPLVIFLIIAPRYEIPFLALMAVALLHTALSCSYILIYPASQAASPSLKIMRLVDKAKPDGLTEEEIARQFESGELLEARIQDLIAAKMIHQKGDQLSLTPLGQAFVAPFVYLRQILGLPLGKG